MIMAWELPGPVARSPCYDDFRPAYRPLSFPCHPPGARLQLVRSVLQSYPAGEVDHEDWVGRGAGGGSVRDTVHRMRRRGRPVGGGGAGAETGGGDDRAFGEL